MTRPEQKELEELAQRLIELKSQEEALKEQIAATRERAYVLMNRAEMKKWNTSEIAFRVVEKKSYNWDIEALKSTVSPEIYQSCCKTMVSTSILERELKKQRIPYIQRRKIFLEIGNEEVVGEIFRFTRKMKKSNHLQEINEIESISAIEAGEQHIKLSFFVRKKLKPQLYQPPGGRQSYLLGKLIIEDKTGQAILVLKGPQYNSVYEKRVYCLEDGYSRKFANQVQIAGREKSKIVEIADPEIVFSIVRDGTKVQFQDLKREIHPQLIPDYDVDEEIREEITLLDEELDFEADQEWMDWADKVIHGTLGRIPYYPENADKLAR